jgi:hypothetical protein
MNYGSQPSYNFAQRDTAIFEFNSPAATTVWGVGSFAAVLVISIMAWAFESTEPFARNQDIALTNTVNEWRPVWP